MASRILLFVFYLILTANPSWAIQRRPRDDPQYNHAKVLQTGSWAVQGKSLDDPPDASTDATDSTVDDLPNGSAEEVSNNSPNGSAEEVNNTANYTPSGDGRDGEAEPLDVNTFSDDSDSEGDGDSQFEHFAKSNMTMWGSKWKSNGRYPRIGIGINCPKCGSSFFHQVIGVHPQIVTGVKKETKYFSADQSLNLCPELPQGSNATNQTEKYLARCFGKNSNGDRQDPWTESVNRTLFEFTPDYLFDAIEHHALVRRPIASVYRDADVRFIALLHDPVLRVISELNMWRETYPMWEGKTDAEMSAVVPGFIEQGKEIIRMGHYAENLKAFLGTTFPQDAILIVNRNALDEEQTWQNVFMFLGLEAYTGAEDTTIKEMLQRAHKHEDIVTHSKEGYLQLSQEATELLKNHYAEHDKKLWKLLKVKTAWW